MPYTRQQWITDDSKRSDLAKLLATSPLKEAIELLVFENLPGNSGLPANDAVARALLNDRREGFFDFLAQLNALTKPAQTGAATPVGGPWEHILRRAVKDEDAPKKK